MAARRRTVGGVGPRAALAPDLDGDGRPEVAETRGGELAHRLVVRPSGSARRVDLKRPRWDVFEVAGRAGGRWLVLALDPGGHPFLLGFEPRAERWAWSVRLPGLENEVDDVDVLGNRVRISVYAATSSRSTVLDVVAAGDEARVTRADRRPVGVRTRSAQIAPQWRIEEVTEGRRESGEEPGRIELVRPDGDRQVLISVDDRLPAARILRSGDRCALVLIGISRVTAVALDGRILATRRLPGPRVMDVAIVGRRLLVRRREAGGAAVVRALRTDPRIGSCG